MFPAQEAGQFEPVKIRKKEKSATKTENGTEANGTATEEEEWEEDRLSEEGAIWPIQKGSIVDWPCFYALMDHVYQTISPPFHTPILIISEPVWTHKEYEKVAQFFFEKFKTPALAMMDAAVAASYAYGIPTATVVDVGFEKADITCISDYVLQDVGRSLALPDCGGEAMTQRLLELLGSKPGFDRDVCEQLKKSAICEILASESDLPTADIAPTEPANPAAAASTGVDASGPGVRKASVVGDVPRGPGPGTEVGEEKKLEDEEGVLDIAAIVTSGNMTDILAQKEKDKAEKAAAREKKKNAEKDAAAANKAARLPNSKRYRNTFFYEDPAALKKAAATAPSTTEAPAAPDTTMTEPQSAVSDKPTDSSAAALTEPSNPESAPAAPAPAPTYRREIEVGPERFQAASGGIIDRLADAIFRTVQSSGDPQRRGDLWDSLIILGNGSKVRGFKETLLATLHARYIISPSSATMFTSELPSNLSTPAATGANTPQLGGAANQPPGPGAVNPLLHAALTARTGQMDPASQLPNLPPGGGIPTPANPGQFPQQQQTSLLQHLHSATAHSQTPTSIRMAKIPEYFPEWKEVGYDEATFLGAQVAGKLLFIVDGGASKGYLTRTDYNEQGPAGIHDVRM